MKLILVMSIALTLAACSNPMVREGPTLWPNIENSP